MYVNRKLFHHIVYVIGTPGHNSLLSDGWANTPVSILSMRKNSSEVRVVSENDSEGGSVVFGFSNPSMTVKQYSA